MKKLFISLLIVTSLMFSAFSVFAATTTQQVTQQNNNIQTLKNEISRLDTQITDVENQINDLNNKINQTSKELLEAQQREAELKQASESRMRAAYMYGSDGYMNWLFSADNPTELLDYYDVTKDIIAADQKTAQELKEQTNKIATLQKQLTQQRDTLVNTKKQAEEAKNQKTKTLESNQNLVAALEAQLTKQNESEIQTVDVPIVTVSTETSNNIQRVTGTSSAIKQQEQQEQPDAIGTSLDVKLPRYIEAVEKEKQGITDNMIQMPNSNGGTISVSVASTSGNWYWPLDGNGTNAFLITSLMGTRESPGGVGSTDHAGTDIGAAYGTAIIAANSGTVEIASTYGGYGNAVMINHNNGYKTLYGHMSSIAVKQGDTVQAGQVIGFVGSTGWSTGPHLHFEVRYTDSNNQESTVNGLSLYGQEIYNKLSYAL